MEGFAMTSRFALSMGSWVLVGSCAFGATGIGQPALLQEFPLRAGASATVANEALTVKFLSVSSDSRCGKGEKCFWEGDATVRIRAQVSGHPAAQFELHTAARMPRSAANEGYTIQLVRLDPIRVTGRTIAPKTYVATLVVVRGSTAEDQLR
jgi:hypothetical protein